MQISALQAFFQSAVDRVESDRFYLIVREYEDRDFFLVQSL